MQIRIDIPEEIIKDAKESPNYYPSYLFGTIWKSIGNGTVLPENCDLVNRNDIEVAEDVYNQTYIIYAPSILEVNKENENADSN